MKKGFGSPFYIEDCEFILNSHRSHCQTSWSKEKCWEKDWWCSTWPSKDQEKSPHRNNFHQHWVCVKELVFQYNLKQISIGNCMNLWAQEVIWKKNLKIAQVIGEGILRTFKTLQVTINPKMPEKVHTIFYLSHT